MLKLLLTTCVLFILSVVIAVTISLIQRLMNIDPLLDAESILILTGMCCIISLLAHGKEENND